MTYNKRVRMLNAYFYALAASAPWYANWQCKELFSRYVDKKYPLGCKARSIVTYDRSLDLIEGK